MGQHLSLCPEPLQKTYEVIAAETGHHVPFVGMAVVVVVAAAAAADNLAEGKGLVET